MRQLISAFFLEIIRQGRVSRQCLVLRLLVLCRTQGRVLLRRTTLQEIYYLVETLIDVVFKEQPLLLSENGLCHNRPTSAELRIVFLGCSA